MNTAKLIKETEKAYQLAFVCWINEVSQRVTTWVPKSMLTVNSKNDDKIEFEFKNSWFLDKKVKEYCQFLKEKGIAGSHIESYLSPISNESVDYCFA